MGGCESCEDAESWVTDGIGDGAWGLLGCVTSILDALPVCWRHGEDVAFTTRLDVCQVFKGSLVTNWFLAKVAILGGVDRENESWKIDKKAPQAVITNKSTTLLSKIFAKAVEGGTESGNMEHVSNENHFSIQRDDRCSCAEDWD